MHTTNRFRSTALAGVSAAVAIVATWGTLSLPCAAQVVTRIQVQVQAAPAADAPAPEAAKAEDEKADAAQDRRQKKRKVPEDGVAAEAEPQPKPKRRPREAPVPVVPGGLRVANPNGLAQQMRGQLEPMLKSELSFATRAADLNDDERRALIAASKKWLDVFVVDLAKNQNPQQQQMWMQNMRGIVIGGNQPKGDDPRTSIQKALVDLIRAAAPPEKVAAYVEECRKRTEFEHRVAVDNLVERLDQKLILSPDQRTKIAAALLEHWDESWAPQLEIFAINMQMWPTVPDEWVVPELSESQRAALKTLTRVSGRMMVGGMAFGMDGDVIDDINLDEAGPLADAPEAAAPAVQPVTVGEFLDR
jgi:hypothetical protein